MIERAAKLPPLLVLALVTAVSCTSEIEARMANDIPEMPTFAPSSSEHPAEDVAFAAECERVVQMIASDAVIQTSIATQSSEWGSVWRADLVYQNGSSGRIICWRGDGGRLMTNVSITQQLEPLDRPAAQ